MNLKFKILGLFFLLSVVSCTNDFEEINTDNNNPADVQPAWLLTAAEKSISEYTWNEWANARWGMAYAQYWAANVYTDETRYKLRDGVNNSYWGHYYVGVISNLNEIIRLCESDPTTMESFSRAELDSYIGAAKTLRAYTFQVLTDNWGNVPYSEAGQGLTNPYPKYDTQAAVYEGIISELKEAIGLFGSGASFSGDMIYYGDTGKWSKFAHSLLMRVGMRIADKNEAMAKDAVTTGASNAFTSASESAVFHFGTSAPNNNPLNEDRKTRSDFAVSNVLMDLLLGMEDPRTPAFADKAKDSDTYIGMEYGLDQENAGNIPTSSVSQPSGANDLAHGVLAADAPMIFMEASEVDFLLAEAVERNFAVSGTAADHYSNAVQKSMDFWGVDAGTYLDRADVDYATATGSWKEKIGRQKYLALYMQGFQGWFEWRRLDFGILQMPADGPLVGDGIPNRRTYPSDEQTLNGNNYTEAVSNQGADLLSTKVWWDVN